MIADRSIGKFGRGNLRAAKLDPEVVYQMREEYALGATQGSLARKYQVSIGTVGRIVRGESWQQYPNPAAGVNPLRPGSDLDLGPEGVALSLERLRGLGIVPGEPVKLAEALPPAPGMGQELMEKAKGYGARLEGGTNGQTKD